MSLRQAEAGDCPANRRLRKVALFLADLQGGGAERMMVSLATGLTDRGVEVDLVLAAARGPYLQDLPGSVRLVDLEAGGVARALPRLAGYLSRERPQLLLATLHHASVVALLAGFLTRGRVPVFLRESNTPSERERTILKPKRWLTAELMRRLYARADGVIAVSEGVAADARDYYRLPAAKVSVLYNPVVDNQLERLARIDPEHPWLAPGEPPVLLAMGRLHPQKDFASLIRAFAKVRSRRQARLIILGEGEERAGLEALVAQLGLAESVTMPGFVDNPFSYLSRAHLFVLSSRWEGLPGALIQALACGCPVVATDCRSGPVEILEAGRYGELVPVGDSEALAAAIERTLEAPRRSEELVERSRDFSREKVVDGYLRLFEEHLSRGGATSAVAAGPAADPYTR